RDHGVRPRAAASILQLERVNHAGRHQHRRGEPGYEVIEPGSAGTGRHVPLMPRVRWAVLSTICRPVGFVLGPLAAVDGASGSPSPAGDSGLNSARAVLGPVPQATD